MELNANMTYIFVIMLTNSTIFHNKLTYLTKVDLKKYVIIAS